MMIVQPEYNIQLEFMEDKATILNIENPKTFRQMLSELIQQINGLSGEWILSEKEKILTLSKAAVCVLSPFLVECNEKKVLNKLYAEVVQDATALYVNETAEINGKIVEYLDKLTGNVPYRTEMDLELDVAALLKIYNVRLETNPQEIVSNLIDYIHVMKMICGYRLIVLVNIKQYLTIEELMEVYKSAFYDKVYLWLIESGFQHSNLQEKNWILDKDLCMIEVGN